MEYAETLNPDIFCLVPSIRQESENSKHESSFGTVECGDINNKWRVQVQYIWSPVGFASWSHWLGVCVLFLVLAAHDVGMTLTKSLEKHQTGQGSFQLHIVNG
ncbi:hypothetical protein TWF102_004257 [Orbilia oligospora]|uniref:Uncharacterized protein n=1 Tax=Orbilia oligospora TaxID=2813651 RepID=A0A7C8NHJ1_ORBOL|nr:hypothetical protein TWF102_004257 [Orbilia oligospora]KAF3117792.1 hypothetical protein TWF103_004466 [Orbilia oligospora]